MNLDYVAAETYLSGTAGITSKSSRPPILSLFEWWSSGKDYVCVAVLLPSVEHIDHETRGTICCNATMNTELICRLLCLLFLVVAKIPLP